ncbi:uncharacterized protein LAESUDRAFT_183526 [Laetiporus sulphureus 93-53]|uniref:F-box domain-containing protein n=1 Tax=Laetiporus sulphureus 93-53 TaxID=1314785 RepID=A0A165ARF3_9APHY|nr:uncharacterized protein LAESUDRAFT_183526 [Laetiporus sulphureus 93-53]KZS99517.1 hypothetical protein LAESUDRAFT_183526 [Laetiporus sulphureus 93-53]
MSSLSLAAILLARKLPQLKTLVIWGSQWVLGTMHSDIFLRLSGFSVTRLIVCDVRFPSITVFGHLVCALPCLVELACGFLSFTHDCFHGDMLGSYRDRVNIRSLSLDENQTMGPEKFIDLLAHPCISGRLQELNLGVKNTNQSQYKWDWQPLLDAASGSLSELRCNLQSSELQRGTEVSTAGVRSSFMQAFLLTKVSLALVPSFTDHTSLQRLWVKVIGPLQDSGLDTLCQMLLSIKSGQLREIVIVVHWNTAALIYRMNQAKEDFLKLHESARHKEIDNHFSSDSFELLSRIEFVLIWYSQSDGLEGHVHLTTSSGEQWKQQLESLFPKLTKRGIFW